MKYTLLLLAIIITGCTSHHKHSDTPWSSPARWTGEMEHENAYPPSYFDALPSITVPQSPYSDEGQSKWFSIGYREGWARGNSGVNAHMIPWYPQHQQFIDAPLFREAHHRGFDGGFGTGRNEAQARLIRMLSSSVEQDNKK